MKRLDFFQLFQTLIILKTTISLFTKYLFVWKNMGYLEKVPLLLTIAQFHFKYHLFTKTWVRNELLFVSYQIIDAFFSASFGNDDHTNQMFSNVYKVSSDIWKKEEGSAPKTVRSFDDLILFLNEPTVFLDERYIKSERIINRERLSMYLFKLFEDDYLSGSFCVDFSTGIFTHRRKKKFGLISVQDNSDDISMSKRH